MKRFFTITISLLFFSVSVTAQEKNTNLYYFIKVWGLLKYYHPEIQKGGVDWNKVFINGVNSLLNNANKQAPAIEELIVISGRNKIPVTPSKLFTQYKNSPYSNLDFDWIFEKDLAISQQDKDWLKQVVENYQPSSNVYIHKEINKFYLNTPLEKFWYPSGYIPDSANSLLDLAKFWNIINYFDPHKKLFDQNWDLSLKQYIPLVLKNASKKEIYLTIASLASSINDSHAFYNNYEFDSLMGLHRPGILTSLYEKKYNLVIYISDTLKKITGISKGDIITNFNGKDIFSYREGLKDYCRGSTERGTQTNIDAEWLKGNYGKHYELEYSDSKNEKKKASFTFTKELAFKYEEIKTGSPVREFASEDAIYVKLSIANKKLLEEAIKKSDHSGGHLILDLRSGALNINWNWLTGKFINSRIQVANYYDCSFTYPGYFEKEIMYKNPVGSMFNKKYSGRLIILANERVMSSLEFNLMILKAAVPELIIVGRNTAGADGAATSILIQDNILTYYTRDVVLFPDGKQTQGIGIIPDIYVEDSVSLFREGKDAIIEKALEHIRQHKN